MAGRQEGREKSAVRRHHLAPTPKSYRARQDGDIIAINADTNSLVLEVAESELAARRREWKPPELKVSHGQLHKYIMTVQSASEGCITDVSCAGTQQSQ